MSQGNAGLRHHREKVRNNIIVLRIEAKAVLGFEIEGVLFLVSGHDSSSAVCRDLLEVG